MTRPGIQIFQPHLGRTMSPEAKNPALETARGYIINMSRWRSILALISCVVTAAFTLYSLAAGIIEYVEERWELSDFFCWFTNLSNILTGLSAIMIIPFAVEGIRKKRFAYPKWAAMLHYSGMVCTTLTMVFTLAVISWSEPELAFKGYNLYFHVICPTAVIIAFFLMESGYTYSLRDALTAAIPVFSYAAVYGWQVFIVGEKNGGWDDMYHLGEYVPALVSLLGVILLTVGISLLIRLLYNRLTLYRRQRLAVRLWPKDVSPVKINVEVFGLGRFAGKHGDPESMEIPLDLINLISVQCGLKSEQLIRIYVRGYLDSLKDRGQG